MQKYNIDFDENIFGHNYTDTIICVAPSGRHILIANYPTALPWAGLFRPFRAVFDLNTSHFSQNITIH